MPCCPKTGGVIELHVCPITENNEPVTGRKSGARRRGVFASEGEESRPHMSDTVCPDNEDGTLGGAD